MATYLGLVRNLRRKAKAVELRDSLPRQHPKVVVSETSPGNTVLSRPDRKVGNMSVWFGQRNNFELDEIGKVVWNLCDGKTSGQKIAQVLQSDFKMHRLEAETALAAFLQMLVARDLIVVEQKSKARK